MYVVAPACRGTAEAVQILTSHAFGDAGSPYLIGLVSDDFSLSPGVYILQNTMARGSEERMVLGKKRKLRQEQNEKEGKRGKKKGDKEKGQCGFFLLIYGTHFR